jgi:glutathione synthase/RimK-type ligase-like ATP-grasp enzyme
MGSNILLATTCRWFSTARLAAALQRAGCRVSVVCPRNHCVGTLHLLDTTYRLDAVRPAASLRAALLASRPELIIPCDDQAMRYLHQVHKDARRGGPESAWLLQRLEFSMGDPAGYAVTQSRDAFMSMINQEGIAAPETKMVASLEEMNRWIEQFGMPAVLKADGTSGGEGVMIIETLAQAASAFRLLQAPVSTAVAAKRALIDGDRTCILPWLEQRRRVVSIQAFVAGPDANMAVAAFQGRILSSLSVEVLKTARAKGPATIVRVIENQQMHRAAEKIVARLGFTGLCGFDFMLDPQTGDAYLIEMNARATQTCTVPLGAGRDAVAAIASVLTGRLEPSAPLPMRSDTIALFPGAWQHDATDPLFEQAYPDIPWESPALVRYGMQQIQRQPRDKWLELALKMRQRWA